MSLDEKCLRNEGALWSLVHVSESLPNVVRLRSDDQASTPASSQGMALRSDYALERSALIMQLWSVELSGSAFRREQGASTVSVPAVVGDQAKALIEAINAALSTDPAVSVVRYEQAGDDSIIVHVRGENLGVDDYSRLSELEWALMDRFPELSLEISVDDVCHV